MKLTALAMLVLCAAAIGLLALGCAEGQMFPDFPDINVEMVVPDITTGEFEATFYPDGPYPKYTIRGYVEVEGNNIRVDIWQAEINGVYIIPDEEGE